MSAEVERCPACGADFQGEEIPEKNRRFYAEGTTHYSRLIGIYDLEEDMTVAWRCPDCKHQWPRGRT